MSKNTTKKERFFDKNLKRQAKKANRRMRELESKGYNSPAYKAVQAQLEMMGVRKTTAKGRRFSESGKATDQNDLRQQLSVIEKFLNSKTSTRTGYEEYRQNIYESASKSYDFDKYGISQSDYEELLESLPDETSDRQYYISYYIEVMEAYTVKLERDKANANTFKEVERIEENKLSIDDIVQIMDSAKDYKTALSNIGLTIKDINKIKKL